MTVVGPHRTSLASLVFKLLLECFLFNICSSFFNLLGTDMGITMLQNDVKKMDAKLPKKETQHAYKETQKSTRKCGMGKLLFFHKPRENKWREMYPNEKLCIPGIVSALPTGGELEAKLSPEHQWAASVNPLLSYIPLPEMNWTFGSMSIA